MSPLRQTLRRWRSGGFTLMEVVIALGILGIKLTAFLLVMSASYDKAYKARDYTVAALLARSKMIDIEQYLFDEGFKEGEESDRGNFGDDGHDKIKWAYRIFEIELDLSGLGGLCGGFSSEEDTESDCESMLAGFGGPFEALTTDIANSVRMVELTLTWPVPPRFEESLEVTALVARQDLKLDTVGSGSAGRSGPPVGPATGRARGTGTGSTRRYRPGGFPFQRGVEE